MYSVSQTMHALNDTVKPDFTEKLLLYVSEWQGDNQHYWQLQTNPIGKDINCFSCRGNMTMVRVERFT